MTYALISVSDKTGIVEFAQRLQQRGVRIISTGGTQKALNDAGVTTIPIDEWTGFPEMMDGRVKTLHPKIHGGLLARRDVAQHQEQAEVHRIAMIDYVVVNLYPFKETILQTDVTLAQAIEQIDIGGPSMLRSAAKNFASVTAIVDPNDYDSVIEQVTASGTTTPDLRQKLAAKVFRHTAHYDAMIAAYLTENAGQETQTITGELKQVLRYGENPQQQAYFYQAPIPTPFSIAAAQQLHGKELSYNNIKDADAALRIIREFTEPCAVALKHMNPCGVGTGATIEAAFAHCYDADPVSIFGGIVVCNRPVTAALAEKLHQIFLEIVIAPSFEEDALAILTQKQNLRLLTVDFSQTAANEPEVVSVLGGFLVQDEDQTEADMNVANWQIVTERQPNESQLEALLLAWKVVKHVKSNAIVIADRHQTLGIGAGQMNRVGAARIALEQARARNIDLSQAVLASDAFFPMSDTVELAAEYGIKAIVQPGGSIKDAEVIATADAHQMVMLTTGIRHFRH
ncbi:bifunctional phosphoribosylaminoimidazolecarboxamide formyltransferase/IMP cyclohydrolase [Aerococcaceae bacterium NML190073]|nr:bifunctional phosphoribosylaminoimidazolecarboxamide formyltransferase/IMP cyclohydrolase [Aerococcaceae bacterium NML190073]